MKDEAKYLWIDLETTGLFPRMNHILELAAIITGPKLEKLNQLEQVLYFHQPRDPAGGFGTDIAPFVIDMHTRNGLFAECEKAWCNAESLDRMVCGVVDQYEWTDKTPILAGSTPHFDRGFIAQYMPELNRRLHYRHFDVSTLKMAVRDCGHAAFGKEPDEPAHRALADIEHSLAVAREFAELVGSAGVGGYW